MTPEQREFDLLTKLTLVRTDLYEVLKVCGIESAGIMTFQEEYRARKRLLQLKALYLLGVLFDVRGATALEAAIEAVKKELGRT